MELEKKHINMDEFRCVKCKKLLAKILPNGCCEIKCDRCGTLNVIFENIDKQVIIVDTEGKVMYINKAMEEKTGYLIQESIGRKISDLWGGQMPKESYRELWTAIKEGKSSQIALINRAKNGELYDIILSVSPVLDVKGNILFYVGVEE